MPLPVLLTRAQIARGGVEGVDITVKSALGPARKFAPTWDMVMGHKRGQISDEEYTRQYHAILDQVDEATWRWLAEQAGEDGVLVLLCYCREEKFCHTHVLRHYAAEKFPQMFVTSPGVY